MKNIIDCLSERGLLDSVTSEELRSYLVTPRKLYLGFDPTADSLHIGHLLGIIILRWFEKYGHTPYILVGGATGRIGDPSGKSAERPLLETDTIKDNVDKIFDQIKGILQFGNEPSKAVFVDNYSWFGTMSFLEFLRDVGKHFRVGVMLGKEMIRNRINSEEGISYTEFSYQILQSYDFYHLSKAHSVSLQIGGSDQWGNIISGIELTRKLAKEPVFGMTFPLLTRSDGKKFGKSEGGAVWLSAEKFSPYDFYQYLYRMPDSDVIRMLKMLTFLSIEEINDIERQMKEPDYVPNTAQKILAKEVTAIVHKEEGLAQALSITESLKPGAITELNVETLERLALETPTVVLKYSQVVGEKWVEIAKLAGLVPSKSEGVRLIQNGGGYLNNNKITDNQTVINTQDLIGERYILLGSGKKKKILVTIEN